MPGDNIDGNYIKDEIDGEGWYDSYSNLTLHIQAKKMQFSRLCPRQQCDRYIYIICYRASSTSISNKSITIGCVQVLERIITPALITTSPMKPCIRKFKKGEHSSMREGNIDRYDMRDGEGWYLKYSNLTHTQAK
jgi:hypothetical protein